MPEIPEATARPKSLPSHRRLRVFRGWWIVAAGFICQVSTGSVTGWIFGLLIQPMEAELSWSRSELVGVLTVVSLLNGGVSAALGPLVDRHGSRWFMVGGAALGGSCLILASLVTTLWQYYLALGLGFGIAEAGLQTVGPIPAIANWFVRKRVQAFTVASIGSPVTGIFLVPAVAWLISSAGWRSGWLVLGLITWLVAPLAWFFVRRRPEDVGLLPDGDDPGQAVATPVVGQAASHLAAEPVWTVGEALHNRSFWLLVFSFSLIMLPIGAIFVHIAPFITGKGLTSAFAAFAISMYGFGTLGGRFVWGYLISRLGIRRALVVFAAVYGFSIVLLVLPSSMVGITAVTALLGMSVGGWLLFQSQTLPDYFGRQIVGSLMGYTGIFLTTARSVSPLFAAVMYDATRNYTLTFSLFALACFVASVVLLFTPTPHASGRQAPLPK